MEKTISTFDREKFRKKLYEKNDTYSLEARNSMYAKSKVDYRKEVIPQETIYDHKMEGKIVVLKVAIQVCVDSDYNPDVCEVWKDVLLTLYRRSKWQDEILRQLWNYENGLLFDEFPTIKHVYLRGKVHHYARYYDRYLQKCHKVECTSKDFYGIRPVYGVKFIVGDDEQYF